MKVLGKRLKPKQPRSISVNNRGVFRFSIGLVEQEDIMNNDRAAIGYDDNGFYLIIFKPEDEEYDSTGIRLRRSSNSLAFQKTAITEYFTQPTHGITKIFKVGKVSEQSDTRAVFPILGIQPPVEVVERPSVGEASLYQPDRAAAYQ